MNRYWMVCRLRWPAILLLTGVIALLDQANILSWGRAWPLYLILWGILALAERALAPVEGPPVYPYGAAPYAASYAPGYAAPAGAPAPSQAQQTHEAPGSEIQLRADFRDGQQMTHTEEGR